MLSRGSNSGSWTGGRSKEHGGLAASRTTLSHPEEIAREIFDLSHSGPVLPCVSKGFCGRLVTPFVSVRGNQGASKARLGLGHEYPERRLALLF